MRGGDDSKSCPVRCHNRKPIALINMTIMTPVEAFSATAAVIGLIVSALSALAAFRSADSARKAQRSADAAIRNTTLVSAGFVAAETLSDLRRVESLAEHSRVAYQTLGIFSGSLNNSGIQHAAEHVAKLLVQAGEHADYARLFMETPSKLAEIPAEDFPRVQLNLNTRRSQISALREELERIISSTEAQNAQYRERVLSQ